ncbi:hypothetical protein GUITHDRAFT_115080 [Guillardia theta CCMP2712]|uniref:Uncharacterized protein n=1 Tax=Guillardia theta (strain CCMP2712) TaxID=905079 RepID=L1IR45_GUITC|nr:hypothetical protein GUITHDRAFT_115080 [Guillardia theta CCMP2712]EKX38751.1 hypothetical protein GUITHDRAFT_115080 [Guillardia theta CCMP2712]|eukprot:XP_005825731.1 hypothetical protein GUITHDRAFT_115080 [Guillardia theta CCMP2712]
MSKISLSFKRILIQSAVVPATVMKLSCERMPSFLGMSRAGDADELNPEALAEITRTVQQEMAEQLKMITQEMNRLKAELYSENGGLAEIQRSLESFKSTKMLDNTSKDAEARRGQRAQVGREQARAESKPAPDKSDLEQAMAMLQERLKSPKAVRWGGATEREIPDNMRDVQEQRMGDVGRSAAESSAFDDILREALRSRNKDAETARRVREGPSSDAHQRLRDEERRRDARAGGTAASNSNDDGFNWKVALVIGILLLLGPFRNVLTELYEIFFPEDEDFNEDFLIQVD